MARRKKPQITGRDPEYTSGTHQFAKLPTNKSTAPERSGEAKSKSEAPADPQPKPKTEKPARQTRPKVASSRQQKPQPQIKAASSQPSSTPKTSGETRRVDLLAALTPELDAKLQELAERGLPYKDVMSLAGRRATKEFSVSPNYVEKPEAERLPTAQAYRSTKSLEVSVLEQLHEQGNPLRLASDGAMVRGQFEPLYWEHLEAVIVDLNKKHPR